MMHVVNKYDFEKNQHFRVTYAFGEGEGGHQKAYAMYARPVRRGGGFVPNEPPFEKSTTT